MLHAFNYSFPATSVIAEAARKRLVEHSKSVEIDAEFLDLARNTDEAHALRMATFIRDKYGNHPPDLVITLGSNALPFVIKYRDMLPDVPVVFASISPQTYAALRFATGDDRDHHCVRSGEDALTRGAAPAGGSPAVCHRWKRRDGSPLATDSSQDDRGARPQIRDDIPVRASILRARRRTIQVPNDAIVIVLTVFADSRRQDLCSGAGRGRFVRAVTRTGLWALRYVYRKGRRRRLC